MKKAIVVGASSGIGRELVLALAKKGYMVGASARRIAQLEELKQEVGQNLFIQQMDVEDPVQARQQLEQLIQQMGGMDIIVLNAAIGDSKPDFEKEMRIIDINVKGFVSLASFAYEYFEKQGGGHIAGTSSVACVRGTPIATTYSASKAFISSYMEGIRHRALRKRHNIAVTDLRPGFVDTDMTKKNKGMFWLEKADRAATDMVKAIERRSHVAYITARWGLVAWLFRRIPSWIYHKY